jgi:hypothetical protein
MGDFDQFFRWSLGDHQIVRLLDPYWEKLCTHIDDEGLLDWIVDRDYHQSLSWLMQGKFTLSDISSIYRAKSRKMVDLLLSTGLDYDSVRLGPTLLRLGYLELVYKMYKPGDITINNWTIDLWEWSGRPVDILPRVIDQIELVNHIFMSEVPIPRSILIRALSRACDIKNISIVLLVSSRIIDAYGN